jgi:hypothetical protein
VVGSVVQEIIDIPEAPGISLEQLREASFEYVRQYRPGDLPLASDKGDLADMDLEFPDSDESRYIVDRLVQFAERTASLIPDTVRQAAAYFDPPLYTPNASEIIHEPINGLHLIESISKHLKFNSKELLDFERLTEDVRYIIESSSRGILGLGKQDRDPSAYQHVLRTLGSATRNFERFLAPIEMKIANLPIPKPPAPELPEDTIQNKNAEERAKIGSLVHGYVSALSQETGNYLSFAWKWTKATIGNSWDATKSGVSRFAHMARLGIGSAWDKTEPVRKAIGFALYVTASPLILSALAIKYAAIGASKIVAGAKQCVASAFSQIPGIKESFDQWSKNQWEKAPVRTGLIATGLSGIATGALAYAGYGGFSWMFPSFFAGIKASEVAISTGSVGLAAASAYIFQKPLGSFISTCTHTARLGIKLLSTPISKAMDAIQETDTYRKFFTGRNLFQTSSYDFLSSDVVGYFKKHSRKLEDASLITSNDPAFWNKMGILDVHVLENNSGKTIQLERFLRKQESNKDLAPQIAEIKKHIYLERTFDALFTKGLPDVSETLLKAPLSAGKAKILLPMGYEITGVRFFDGERELIEKNTYPVKVTECVFGSAEVVAPLGTRSMEYLIKPTEYRIPPEQIERLKRLLPPIPAFRGIEGEAYAEALSKFNLSKRDEMALLFDHQAHRGFKIVDDSFIKSFIATSGSAVTESVGGMRLGSKDAITYYNTAIFNSNGVPSLLVTGLVPNARSSSYPLKTGHSQTAVLTEDGAIICDLSDKAEASQTTGSKSLMVGEKLSLLRRLSGLSYHQVFDYASEIREVVTKEGKELGFFNDLVNRLFSWRGYGLPFVRRTYKDAKIDQKIETDFDAIKKPPLNRIVTELSKTIALEKHIDYCRRQGTVSQVLSFYKENNKLETLLPSEIAKLPEEYKNINSYNIRQRVVDFVGESLRNDQFSPTSRRASLDWIISRLPAKEKVLGYFQDQEYETSLNRYLYSKTPHEGLNVEEVLGILSAESIAKLSDSQAKSLLFGTLALPFTPVVKAKTGRWGEDRIFEREDIVLDESSLISMAQCAEQLAERISDGKIPLSRQEKEALVVLLSNIGTSLIKKTYTKASEIHTSSDRERAISQCAKIISITTNRVNTDQVSFYFDLVMSKKTAHTDSVIDFANAVGRDLLFEIEGQKSNIDRLESSLGQKATRVFCEKQLADFDFKGWSQTLSFFDALGLSPARYADRERIAAHLKRELTREAKKGLIKVGFPDEIKHPASFLSSRLFDDYSVQRLKLGQQIEAHGMLNQGQLELIWPDISEQEALSLLLKEARPFVSKHPRNLFFGASYINAIPVEKSHALTLALIGKGLTSLESIATFNAIKESNRHWSETAITSLRDNFPKEWQTLLKQFGNEDKNHLAAGVVNTLFSDLPKPEIYRGFLALTAAGVTSDIHTKCDDFQNSIRSLRSQIEPGKLGEIHSAVSSLFPNNDSLRAPFNNIPAPLQCAVALGTALIREIKVQENLAEDKSIGGVIKELWHNGPWYKKDSQREAYKTPEQVYNEGLAWSIKSSLSENFNVERPLMQLVEGTVANTSKTAESAVWKELFTPRNDELLYNERSLKALEKESKRTADAIAERYREPLAQFLFSRSGCVLVDARSGELKGYRDYGEGDSLRHIDWKRSAKDSKLTVRLKDEEESRNIRIIADLEHLNSSFENWLRLSPEQRLETPNELGDLFAICHLAMRENISVDLVLYGRSNLQTFNDIVRHNNLGPKGKFDVKYLVNHLGLYLQKATQIHAMEERIFEQTPRFEVNIFDGDDFEAKPGRLHLFSVSETNLSDTQKHRDRLKRKNISSAFMRRHKSLRGEDDAA